LISLMLIVNVVAAQSNSSRKAAKGAGDGAFFGALAGAVFGDGNFWDDAAEGSLSPNTSMPSQTF